MTESDKKRNFFENVYAVVRQVPPGRVTTYGAIAAFLGAKRSARLVGWAMISSHAQAGIPAHRVINRNGVLTGKHFFGGPDAMQRLLEAEGVEVENDQVKDFDHLFWDPARELL